MLAALLECRTDNLVCVVYTSQGQDAHATWKIQELATFEDAQAGRSLRSKQPLKGSKNSPTHPPQKSMTIKTLCLSVFLLLSSFLRAETTPAERLQPVRDADRIVFVGDSITGQGGGNAAGFVHLIEWALRQSRPANTMKFIPLGGSGQSVGSWLSVEEKSRTTESNLDVKGFGVKENLDQPADVLVIMLGMNDILAPYLTEETKEVDAWAERYRVLIRALRERVKPRVLALAQITMATEDPASPKNRVIALLNARVAALAKEQNALLLPTNETAWKFLEKGRQYRSDFHLTGDHVHPTSAGHVAIAVGMLKGLGEEAAARQLLEHHAEDLWKQAKGELPSLASVVEPVDASPNGQKFRLRYWWTGLPGQVTPRVSLSTLQGWQVSPPACEAATGEFLLEGKPDHLKNDFILEARSGDSVKKITATIPAPWLIAAGVSNGAAWPSHKYDPAGGRLPMDEAIFRGDTGASKLAWQRYFPSINFTGGASPDSVDFWAASFGNTFEAGYGARWINSGRERPVTLLLSSAIFAGKLGLEVWLNGAQVYAGTITGEPGKKVSVPATLRQGTNTLIFKCNHLTYLWQVAVGLSGAAADDLSDLRYSTVAPGGAPQ